MDQIEAMIKKSGVQAVMHDVIKCTFRLLATAEAENDKLRDALREIADMTSNTNETAGEMWSVAITALAAQETEGGV